MILSFSTHLNGQPTYFVEKIWAGFKANDMLFRGASLEVKNEEYLHRFGKSPFECKKKFNPKITTIREDRHNRWTKNTWIDFCINPRSERMFNFAPRFRVITIQRVFMTYLPHLGNGFEMSIDGKYCCDEAVRTIAQNDGFDSTHEFVNYFIRQMKDGEFSGKIIHWTDLKY